MNDVKCRQKAHVSRFKSERTMKPPAQLQCLLCQRVTWGRGEGAWLPATGSTRPGLMCVLTYFCHVFGDRPDSPTSAQARALGGETRGPESLYKRGTLQRAENHRSSWGLSFFFLLLLSSFIFIFLARKHFRKEDCLSFSKRQPGCSWCGAQMLG